MTATRNLAHFVRHLDGGVARMEFEVDGRLRAGCTQTIEGSLEAIPDITRARVSVAERRVAVEWRDGKVDPARFVNRLSELGYDAHPCGGEAVAAVRQPLPARLSRLLCRLGVAALAALVIRLLPFVIWPDAGAAITSWQRDLLHGLSALIALPAAAWAGRPFFNAAISAAAAGRLSRETPLSAGILLALGLSISGTLGDAVEASYDWGLMLLALALALRLLELTAQRPAGGAEAQPSGDDRTVTKFVSGAGLAETLAQSIRPGDLILVRPGERIVIDGVVTDGRSEIDQSGVTGETLPASAARDSIVYAGTLNISGTLRVRAGVFDEDAPPAGVGCLSARTADGSGGLLDHVARFHPLLTLAAALAALAEQAASGADWREAATAAIAVLVVANPAVLSIAAATVETWAERALFRAGVALKSWAAVERLAGIDTILFDKTGTLTLPESEVINASDIPPERLAVAGRLALASRHPLAAAVVRAAGARQPLIAIEEPGRGVRSIFDGVPVRLGRPSFCDAERNAASVLETDPEASVIAFAYGNERHVMAVRQRLRSDAIETVAQLQHDGFAVEIVSGDRAPAVAHAARTLGVAQWRAGMTPADKAGYVSVLQAHGRNVLMIGDGLNDAAALAAADAALSVQTFAPPELAAADGRFASDRLAPVAAAIEIARKARRLRRQNIWFVAGCAAMAASVAIAGAASPLAAALAMSGAAIAVTLNAMRVGAVGMTLDEIATFWYNEK